MYIVIKKCKSHSSMMLQKYNVFISVYYLEVSLPFGMCVSTLPYILVCEGNAVVNQW